MKADTTMQNIRTVLCGCSMLAGVLGMPGQTFAQTAPQSPPAASTPAASKDAGAAGNVLRLHGSNTIGAELAPELLTAFGRQAGLTATRTIPGSEPETRTIIMDGGQPSKALRAEVSARGSTTAFPALRDKQADIGMASRLATEAEIKFIDAAGQGDLNAPGNSTAISLDGVLVLVHPDNPLNSLTLDQVRDIFTGTVTNWSAVGGWDAPINLYRRDSASGTFDTFRSLALKGAAVAKTAKSFDSSEDLADSVAADAKGIGFVGFAYARNAKPLALKLACGLEMAPQQFSVRTEEYPLSRRLMFYTPAEKSAVTQDFLRFATSTAAQPIVQKAGFINFLPEMADSKDRAARLESFGLGVPAIPAAKATAAEFKRVTEGWQRLSTTFRFQNGVSLLDERSREDLTRVAAWLKGEGAGRKLMLIGYASKDGAFDANRWLSLRRAREVGNQLAAVGVRPVQFAGMGGMGQVGCDDLAAVNGGLNRRVEVWVK